MLRRGMIGAALFAAAGVAAGCASSTPGPGGPESPSQSVTTAEEATKSDSSAPRQIVRTVQPTLVGYWRGAIARNGSLQELALWAAEENGELALRVDVPNWNLVEYPVPHSFADGALTFRLGPAQLTFAVDLEGGAARGTLTTPGRPETEPLVAHLTRLPAPDIPPVVQLPVEFTSADGVTLTGTIAMPEGEGPFPGLVIVQGRSYGPSFQFLGHAVRAARSGVAAIVFNGRGVGGSGGERGKHTLAHRLDDAMAAFEKLADHPKVDGERIGMFGHSAGGWIAPVLAHKTGRLAFVILHSGPAVNLAVQQAQVVRELLRRSGKELSESDYRDAFAYQEKLTRLAMDGAPWSDIEAHVATAADKPWGDIVDTPADYEDNGSVGYFRRVPHDSDEALASLRVPTLAIFGADDFVVPPEHNVPVLERVLRAAGNDDFEIVVFPRANHDLMIEASKTSPGWDHRPPSYVETLRAFLERVTSN